MIYIIKMCDLIEDAKITKKIEAKNVFEAIDIVTETLNNPGETELIEAIPLFNASN